MKTWSPVTTFSSEILSSIPRRFVDLALDRFTGHSSYASPFGPRFVGFPWLDFLLFLPSNSSLNTLDCLIYFRKNPHRGWLRTSLPRAQRSSPMVSAPVATELLKRGDLVERGDWDYKGGPNHFNL